MTRGVAGPSTGSITDCRRVILRTVSMSFRSPATWFLRLALSSRCWAIISMIILIGSTSEEEGADAEEEEEEEGPSDVLLSGTEDMARKRGRKGHGTKGGEGERERGEGVVPSQ